MLTNEHNGTGAAERHDAGFRLERLELWNWGTFHGEAQTLEPDGGWALLVGDNGSGKSTAIDALRTLLVPPRILNYNDASGDGRRPGGRDRTRRSYVRGAWASSSTVDSTAPTTQYLREAGALSAIAAVFTDGRRQVSATLAQVLWEHEEQVRELYAVASGRRSLRDLIAGHSNTADIRRAARRGGWQIEDSFAAYAERMRSLLCIPGDKALEVFNRAIGM
ncbi:MAG TPA: ATP-binding protein, partial [Burkholderiales bacterium]|nr:ATP-binding protein [Burkholderiales bacterium]